MRKIAPLFLLTALFTLFYSCGEKHSKAFQTMDKEANELQVKIEETNDCDELRLFSFSILGLKSDVENLLTDETVKDGEIETMNETVDRIEALWNGKIASLDCKEPTEDESELDTTAEDDFTEYDIL